MGRFPVRKRPVYPWLFWLFVPGYCSSPVIVALMFPEMYVLFFRRHPTESIWTALTDRKASSNRSIQ